jgi:uncharacterized small protein (DUF1192 family)
MIQGFTNKPLPGLTGQTREANKRPPEFVSHWKCLDILNFILFYVLQELNELKNKIQRLEAEIVQKDALISEREFYISNMENSAMELEDKICCLNQENAELKSQSATVLADGNVFIIGEETCLYG